LRPPNAGPTLSVEQLGGSKSTRAENPFIGARFFINPAYKASVEAAAAADPTRGAQLVKVAAYPTAIWLDSIAAVANVSTALDQALEQQARSGQPVVTVFVVYDLPNRDCAAEASNGELSAEDGGEERYKRDFIDQIAAQFQAHNSQRIVAIVEPDSLPNLVTNMNIPKCAASGMVYRRSISYAISKLSMPHVYLYLDAAHAGWLGWDDNRSGAARVFREVLNAAGGVQQIRGFATNVANYTPLKRGEGKTLDSSNPCPDEITYVKRLSENLNDIGIENAGFIIDTSRNGRSGIRQDWGSWCNVKGAGLGERPQASPAPLIDAYYWVKPPGESDGVSDPSAPRFDPNCRSSDSAQNAPQAGQWFQSFFVELVRNAIPPL
jgi:cellulose 1,4-beta-cellobiosidase